MQMLKTLLIGAGLAAVAISPTLAQDEAPAEEWTELFNGESLEGWTPKFTGSPLGENFLETFRVEDGLLTASYENYDQFDGQFGHLFYEKPFSNYVLRVEYRFVGEQVENGPGWARMNSGVMFHSEAPEQMTLDQSFPTSIEVQTLGANEGETRTTGNLCTPGTNVVLNGQLEENHCITSSSDSYPLDEWVTLDLEVHGNGTVRHIVNGQVVLEYEQPQLDLRDEHARELAEAGHEKMLSEGYIAVQAESHPVQYRRIAIRELNP